MNNQVQKNRVKQAFFEKHDVWARLLGKFPFFLLFSLSPELPRGFFSPKSCWKLRRLQVATSQLLWQEDALPRQDGRGRVLFWERVPACHMQAQQALQFNKFRPIENIVEIATGCICPFFYVPGPVAFWTGRCLLCHWHEVCTSLEVRILPGPV